MSDEMRIRASQLRPALACKISIWGIQRLSKIIYASLDLCRWLI